MNKKKIRQIAKRINNGKPIEVKFIFAPADHFHYVSKENFIVISTFYYKLSFSKICMYMAHEIGHANTIPQKNAMYVSDYTAEYEANRWAMYRLDELKWVEVIAELEKYIHEMADLEVSEDTIEYKEAATDLILDLGLT
jgi:hypothetical protein